MTSKADKKARTEMLKGVREAHAESVAHTQKLLREQKQIQKDLTEAIKDQPGTVPEVAEATGMPSHQVLWWLAVMRKYGLVAEDGMRDDYPVYKLVEETQ